MTDLTVLVSPIPLYPDVRDFSFVRRPKQPITRPIMVTLETEKEEADRAQNSPIDQPADADFINPPTSPPRHFRTPRVVEPHLLSPPVNTWKSRPRHRPTRSQSAPPERRTPAPTNEEQPEQERVRLNTEALGFRQRNPNRSFTSFTTVDRNTTRGGELIRPPPPLRKAGSTMDTNSLNLPSNTITSATAAAAMPTSNVAKRQAGANSLTALTPASSTYDFWWPFPPADVSPLSTTAIPTPSSVIPIVSSLISTVPSTSDSDTTSVTSAPLPTSSAISRTHSSSSSTANSAQISATAPAELNAPKPHFNFIDLVPAFGVVGVFLLGLGIWVIYGCCTRKPKVSKDDGELISGPPYVGLHASDTRDVEQRGQAEDMIYVRKFGQGPVGAQYRWPSFSEPPVFDEKPGFSAPKEYMHHHPHEDEDTTLLPVSLLAPGRRKSGQTSKSSSSSQPPISSQAGPSRAHVHAPVSRQHSSATSAALHDLYESDSEEDARRRALEPPWESLRHKSIKRGILEQVKKENTWMDSVRSSLMGMGVGGPGATISDGPKRRGTEKDKSMVGEERQDARGPAASSSSSKGARNLVGRRRGHVRADSDVLIGNNDATFMRDGALETRGLEQTRDRGHGHEQYHTPTERRGAVELEEYFTRKPHETPAQSPKHAPRGRRTFAWLKDAEREDRYTPLPARLHSSRSRSRSESEGHSRSCSRSRSKSRRKEQSTSPTKRLLPRATTRSVGGSNNTARALAYDGDDDGEGRLEGEWYTASESAARALNILPQSPPQIMSPPLESQICFTPIPPLALSPKAVDTRTLNMPWAMKIPSPKNSSGKRRSNSRSRSKHRSTVSSPDATDISASASVSSPTTTDVLAPGRRHRGLSPKRKSGRAQSPPGGVRIRPLRPARKDAPGDEVGTETIMQKVDHIMEAGWHERDLGLEAIRSLSPTGFGRDA